MSKKITYIPVATNLLLLFLFAVLPDYAFAQKAKDNYDKSMVELDFDCSGVPCHFSVKGTFNDDIATLRNDSGDLFDGFDFQVDYGHLPKTPNPIAYISSQPGDPALISVSVELDAPCETLPTTVGVRGVSSQGYHFPAKEVDVTPVQDSGSHISYTAEASSNKLSFVPNPLPTNTVNMFDLDITWEVCTLGQSNWGDDANWELVAAATNRVYVTWKEPKPETGSSYQHFETTFYLGSNFAKGETGADGIISKVWEDGFRNTNITNVKGDPMHYYKDWMTDNNGPSQLVEFQDGICFSWTKFFLDVFKAQGIDYQGYELGIWPSSDLQRVDGFFVKNWDFLVKSNMLENHPSQTVQNLLNDGFDYLATFKGFGENEFNYNGNKIRFTYEAEVIDLDGKMGKNTSNPLSIFSNHAIAKINDMVYDPSYGNHSPINFSNDFINDYEDNNIAGYYFAAPINGVDENIVDIDLNGDGSITSDALVYFYFIKKQVNEDNDLRFTETMYLMFK